MFHLYRYGLRGIVADPEECDMEDLGKIKELEDELEGPTLAVFMMATYGEGDPTDNAQEFFDWLKGEPDGLEGQSQFRHYVANLVVCAYVEYPTLHKSDREHAGIEGMMMTQKGGVSQLQYSANLHF